MKSRADAVRYFGLYRHDVQPQNARFGGHVDHFRFRDMAAPTEMALCVRQAPTEMALCQAPMEMAVCRAPQGRLRPKP
jgi:hypothetical protein